MLPGPSFLITFKGSLVGGGGVSLTLSWIGAGLAAGVAGLAAGVAGVAGLVGAATFSGAFVAVGA